MSAGPWVWCGGTRLPAARADAFEPPARLPRADDLGWAVERALAGPLAAPRLRELARGAASVVVTIPDASRPCPSPAVLEQLVPELRRAGVGEDRVAVAVGCGLHATTTEREKDALAGLELRERVEVFDAQGSETATADLGVTSRGAPVHIARRVAEADLVVTVGVVEPHLYAGFSGGVKGVAIGCAGHQTIAWTHRPAFVTAPGVAVGELAGNPFQETLREIAARTRLAWGVNLVVDQDGEATAVAAGEPAAVQALLVRAHGRAWLRPVRGPFDVIVAGVHAPKSANLYQASRAATYIGLAARPALADGGLIVLCADLPDGCGAGPAERNFAAVLAAASSPDELAARGLREPLGPGGQRSFVVARLLQRFRLAVVGAARAVGKTAEAPVRTIGDAGGTPDSGLACVAPYAHLGVAAFDSVDAAVAGAEERLGRRARVLAVADAMTTVVRAG